MTQARGVVGSIGLFGGTFDPVHVGHLRTAYELRQRLGLDELRFIPAPTPPHRPPPAAPIAVRIRMLEAAVADEQGFTVDLRELDRNGPSYSIDTAISLREEFPGHALCLLLGMDAFVGLPAWHQWQRLLSLVNIVVAQRPGAALPTSGTLGELLAEHRVEPGTRWAPQGQIVIQAVTQLEVSSTGLRDSIRAGLAPKYLVPDVVREIIAETGCYAQ